MRLQDIKTLLDKEVTIRNNTSELSYEKPDPLLIASKYQDELDMGLWSKIDKKDLLMPLDTHTFKMSQKLGLLKRKSYDMKAVFELTDRFRQWDKNDPVKYDFALYRIGQEKLLKI